LLLWSLLIAVHECGHYMAVACGVKMLRFSVGFGKPLLTLAAEQFDQIYCWPCCRWVAMVSISMSAKAPVDRQNAIWRSTQLPAFARSGAAAGRPICYSPFLLYSVVQLGRGPGKARTGLASGRLAGRSRWRGGEWVLQTAPPDEAPSDVVFEDLRWRLTQAALSNQDMTLRAEQRTGNTRCDAALADRCARQMQSVSTHSVSLLLERSGGGRVMAGELLLRRDCSMGIGFSRSTNLLVTGSDF
jgi:regulator of sigma E protease